MGSATILKDLKDGPEHAKVCTKSIGILEGMKPYILEYGLNGILFHFLQRSIIRGGHEVLQEGETVKILDPYDGGIAGIGRIHSLFVIHGVALCLKDENVNSINVINVTSNISLPYEDGIDGCLYLKEKERIFIRFPKKYLEKSSN